MALTKLNFSGQGSIIGSLPSGAVIQTVEGTKTTNNNATSSRSFIDMENLSVSITPTFANSKFKIMLQSNHQMQYSIILAVDLWKDLTLTQIHSLPRGHH